MQHFKSRFALTNEVINTLFWASSGLEPKRVQVPELSQPEHAYKAESSNLS